MEEEAQEGALSCLTSNGVVASDDKPFERIMLLHVRAISRYQSFISWYWIDRAKCKTSADTPCHEARRDTALESTSHTG
jgi:hypothetical protein